MQEDRAAIAERLLAARDSGTPIELLSEEHEIPEAEAYAIQDLVVDRVRRAAGEGAAGYKIAMTSPATMALAGASEPAYGVLTGSMIRWSPAEVAPGELYQPRLEAELVFRIEDDLEPGAGADEIRRASTLAPGLELPSARYRDWFGRMKVADLVSDNTATGLLVVADSWRPAAELPLDGIRMRLRHDGRTVDQGVSSAVFGSPELAVAWLSARLAGRGRALRAGTLVSSGTFTMPIPAEEGLYEAEFDGVGSVAVRFRS